MRARILLSFIICLAVSFTDLAAQAVESKKPEAGATLVRPVTDKSVSDLIVRIKDAKDLKNVWKDFSKVESDIAALRKKEKRQSEIDEIHLDSLTSSLKEIPREKKFAKGNCAKVKSQIVAEYSPYPKEDGELPEFVKLTTGVLDALCAK